MDEQKPYLVRTLYLANYADAAANVARLRRNPTDADALRTALKRMEMADKMLEDELNSYAEKGYTLVEALRHDVQDQPGDLLFTAVFYREKS